MNMLLHGVKNTEFKIYRGDTLTNDWDIDEIVGTYQHRKEKKGYSKRVTMKEIASNDYNLNISRYVSTAQQEPEIDLAATHRELVEAEKAIRKATARHNEFLRELGLPLLPSADSPLSKK